MSSITIARPLRSRTFATSPTVTPATATVCPWPGVIACALDSSTPTR
jgi:hypothetical protein